MKVSGAAALHILIAAVPGPVHKRNMGFVCLQFDDQPHGSLFVITDLDSCVKQVSLHCSLVILLASACTWY